VVRQVAHHPLLLLLAVGREAQVAVVVLVGREAQQVEARREARAQRRALRLVVVEAEALVHEVAQQAELLLAELRVVVAVAVLHRGCSLRRALAAAWRTSGEGSLALRSTSGRSASRKPPSPSAPAASARTAGLSSSSPSSSRRRAAESSKRPARSTSSLRASAVTKPRRIACSISESTCGPS